MASIRTDAERFLARLTLLLLDAFDGGETSTADARLRLAMLTAAGAVVRAVGWNPTDRTALPTGSLLERRRSLDEMLAATRPAAAIVASAAAGGGDAAGWLPRGMPAWWWPTAVGPAAGWRFGFARRALPALDREWTSALDAGFAGPPPGPNGAQSLWDGPYVLCPHALTPQNADPVLAAFACVASGLEALDLVVLGDPDPGLERRTRALGIATRVHFAGPAARGAEWPWLSCARATVLAGGAPIAPGLVWRALAAGCPILANGARGPAAEVARWLDGQRLAMREADLGAALAAAVARKPEVELTIARGRVRASKQSGAVLPGAIGAALASLDATPQRAAA